MENVKLEINMQFCQMSELSQDEIELIEKAKAATASAYAKYSHFKVGAALRLKNGTIVIGANQENAAFPSGLCAERTAVFAAQANFPEQPIASLAIAASNENGFLTDPITPCGSCRQVLLEIEDRYQQPVKIYLYGLSGVYVINSIKDLMPLSFVGKSMR